MSYYKGKIKLQIKSLMAEKFINLLWSNKINMSKVKKEDIATYTMEINSSDFDEVLEMSKVSNVQIKVIKGLGISFYINKLKKEISLILGIVIFISVILYLSSFIWRIEINTEGSLTPYEVRQVIYELGVKVGSKKDKEKFSYLEERIMERTQNILWFDLKVEGVVMKINVAMRQSPPDVEADNSVRDIVSKMDGEIVRIVTTSGTAMVKPGDMVKKGDLLIKGRQGNEGKEYEISARGEVYAKTYYELTKAVNVNGEVDKRTGKKFSDIYIELKGNKIYLKKTLNKFDKYVKINSKYNFFHVENYYETNKVNLNIKYEEIIQDACNELENELINTIGKDAIITNRVTEEYRDGDTVNVRCVFVVEQSIGKVYSYNSLIEK